MNAMTKTPAPTLRPNTKSRVQRWLTLLALQTTARLYRAQGACLPISRHKIVKIRWQDSEDTISHLVEATTMQYVATQTSIRVPKVHCTFEHKGRGYIVMERLRGQTLGSTLHLLSSSAKETIFSQLRAALDQLRSLEPPSNAVQSCVGGPISDVRIAHARNKRFGPFESVAEFHLWLRQYRQLPLTNIHWSDKEVAAIENMIACQDAGSWPRVVFTHADLNASNIIVHDDSLVGIIDWEFAGWYPSYWEYTAAWCTAVIATDWRQYLECFMETWPKELEMEITRNDYWGQI